MFVVIGAIFYGVLKSGVSKGKIDASDYCVTISDGKYKLVSLDRKTQEEDIVIADIEGDSSSSGAWNYFNENYVHMTGDGKYLYFISEPNDSSETGNLYRAELKKIRSNTNNNSKYIIKIASDVKMHTLIICEDDTVVYQKQESSDNNMSYLYYFDGEKNSTIASNVYISKVCGDYIFYLVRDNDEETYTLYGQILGNDENKRKIAAYTDGNFYIKDPEHIIYTKSISDEDNVYNVLYIAGYSTEPEKLSDNVYDGYWYNSFEQTEGFYYTEASDNAVNLSDFVENPYYDEDEWVVEPDYNDEKYEDDYASYEMDYEKYKISLERRDLMEYLSEVPCTSIPYSLYYYEFSSGKPVLISDQIDNYQINYRIAYSNGHNAAAYFKRPDTIRKINIEQVLKEYDGTYSDAESIVANYIGDNCVDLDAIYFTLDGGEERNINLQNSNLESAFGNKNIPFFTLAIYNEGDKLAFFGGKYDASGNCKYSDDIYTMAVSESEIGEMERISAIDAVNIDVYGDQLGYYTADGDFYMYINNEHILVMKDALYSIYAKGYADGSMLIYTYQNGGTIDQITEDGKINHVADEASLLKVLTNGDILYLMDNELILYDGKKDSVLVSDTDYFWCLEKEEL